MHRPAALARFISAFDAGTRGMLGDGHPASAITQRVCSALQRPSGDAGDGSCQTLPACRHLDAALAHTSAGAASLAELADALHALAPLLLWCRSTRAGTPEFSEGHANTQIVGPDGMERRSDVVLGASLLAPNVAYPFHGHPPEEIYLVMSEGEWFTREAGWYSPGIGGIVHHPPDVMHAMRSGATPLLAVWCLWTGT